MFNKTKYDFSRFQAYLRVPTILGSIIWLGYITLLVKWQRLILIGDLNSNKLVSVLLLFNLSVCIRTFDEVLLTNLDGSERLSDVRVHVRRPGQEGMRKDQLNDKSITILHDGKELIYGSSLVDKTGNKM